ncbi:MAG: ATPase domain-containing protein [Calditrichota bacterium]
MYTRISSGLDFLDASLGGLFSNRCYLLRGPSQSGRTTACLQFLISGLDNGENCMMISSDRIENVILKAEAVGISLEPYLMENRLVLMEYPKEILSGSFQYGSIIHMLGEIEQYLRHYNCTRLVFDTLIPLLSNPREAQLVNYIYSLMNSLEALQTTTLVTTGEPNSSMAVRIIQLVEDAVVGSFALTSRPSKQNSHREFITHKMINPVTPPTKFRVRFEYGVGLVQDLEPLESAADRASLQTPLRSLSELPLQVVLIDQGEDCLGELEDIFPNGGYVKLVERKEEFQQLFHHLDCDLLIINAALTSLNWRDLIAVLRQSYPKLPVFLLADRLTSKLTYQIAKQIGADALFIRPAAPDDILKALETTLKKNGTLDELFERRGLTAYDAIPEDMNGNGKSNGGMTGIGTDSVNLLNPQMFRERVQRQILRSSQGQGIFSLLSIKIVYTPEMAKQTNIPQGLELVKRVASLITASLRGMNDSAARYMDKIVVLLEDTDREGAQAFARRVVKQLKVDLSTLLNVQVGRHINILTAFGTYPVDADNVTDLIAQVTEISRNFVKTPIN